MPTEPTLFFDLDGTLTDPKPGITGSIQYALQKLDREVPSQDELAWCIGPPLRASFVMLLGGEEHADRAVAFYRERFGHREGEFPVCEDVAARSIALPFFPQMTEGQVERVGEGLRQVLQTARRG